MRRALALALLAVAPLAHAQERVVAADAIVWIAGGEVTVGATEAELLGAIELCSRDTSLTGEAAGCPLQIFLPESPARRVYVAAFGLDRTEVTNARFRSCVLDGACSPSRAREDDPRISAPDMPVVGVSALDAERFCAWAGGRLPTEEEWEKAARGDSSRIFPWGDAWGEGLANHGAAPFRPDTSDGFDLLAPVGSFPAGASPYGVLDMAGNVWEWTATAADAEDFASIGLAMAMSGLRVVRGGAFDHPAYMLRVTARLPFTSEVAVAGDIGFRCAYDPF